MYIFAEPIKYTDESGEVIAFARMVQQRVKERFGIEIDTEVNIL